MQRLSARGHDVQVLCSDQHLPGVEARAEPGVHRRLRLYLEDERLLSPPLRQRVAIERHNQQALADVLDTFRPDVVSVWHVGAMSLGLLTTLVERGVPLVYSVCDEWLTYADRLDAWARLFRGDPLRRLIGRFARLVLRVPTTVADIGASGAFCFISGHTRRNTVAGSPWALARTTVVWNGIERGVFRPPMNASESKSWRWRLFYSGRYDPRKGTDTLVRALQHLPDEATLELSGRGGDAERARLEQLAADLGLRDRVSFVPLQRHELRKHYAAADVVVFPSEWAEPFGLVPLEAMACGTPVVATGAGGSGEFLFDGRNCVRFAPGDAAGLADAVCRVHDDERLRVALVEAGYATAAAFDIDHLVDAIDEWHAAAIGGFEWTPAPRVLSVAGVDVVANDPLPTGALAVATANVGPGESVRVEVPNTGDIKLLAGRVADRWRGVRLRPPPAGATRWHHLGAAVPAGFDLVSARPVAWRGGRRGRLAAMALRLPGARRFSKAIEVELVRR